MSCFFEGTLNHTHVLLIASVYIEEIVGCVLKVIHFVFTQIVDLLSGLLVLIEHFLASVRLLDFIIEGRLGPGGLLPDVSHTLVVIVGLSGSSQVYSEINIV